MVTCDSQSLSALSQTPASILSLIYHTFAQVRWLLMAVNEHSLTDVIAMKLMCVQLTDVTRLTDVHNTQNSRTTLRSLYLYVVKESSQGFMVYQASIFIVSQRHPIRQPSQYITKHTHTNPHLPPTKLSIHYSMHQVNPDPPKNMSAGPLVA